MLYHLSQLGPTEDVFQPSVVLRLLQLSSLQSDINEEAGPNEGTGVVRLLAKHVADIRGEVLFGKISS